MDVEELWEALLSRRAGRIRQAYDQLNQEERTAVLAHLRKMAYESGWHAQQAQSAQAALHALSDSQPPQEP